MASGRFELLEEYNGKSPDCVSAFVDWTSTLLYDSTHSVECKLYGARIDYGGATNIQYQGPSGWTKTYTNPTLVFKNKSHVHIATWKTEVISGNDGKVDLNAYFHAGFHSSSYGTRRMYGTMGITQLDKPKLSVTVDSPSGISCTVSKSRPCAGDKITISVKITNTTKYSDYKMTVVGASHYSGNTYTVTDDVYVTIKGVLANYTIYVTTDDGVSASVENASGISYGNGSVVEYGTLLTISIKVKVGYEFVNFFVNDIPHGENDLVTINSVESDIVVTAKSRESGVVYINDETGISRYQVYICSDTGWSLYKPYLYTETGWGICG